MTTIGNDEFSHLQPNVVPGARAVLFTVQTRAFRWNDARIEVLVRDTGERKRILQGTDARYLPTGHLVYALDGTLLAAPFDVGQLQLTGGALALLDNVMHAIAAPNSLRDTGAAQFEVSESGALAFVPGGTYPPQERIPVWVDRGGRVEPIDLPVRQYNGPRLSPDGTRLAMSHMVQPGDGDIWMYDLQRGTSIRLTADGGHAWLEWTPDGRRLTFYKESQGASNLFWLPVDGSGSAERLTTSPYQQRIAGNTRERRLQPAIEIHLVLNWLDELTRTLASSDSGCRRTRSGDADSDPWSQLRG